MNPLEVVQRLTLYAYMLFGRFPEARFEPVVPISGMSPEDLAMKALTQLLDPTDHSVVWKNEYGEPTTLSVVAFLKSVLYRDYLDIKKSKELKSSISISSLKTADENGDKSEMHFDYFASKDASPEERAALHEERARIFEHFADEPELLELLSVQLDPEGYQAYTNQDLSKLLNKSVPEIENLKKRIMRKLLKLEAAEVHAPRKKQ